MRYGRLCALFFVCLCAVAGQSANPAFEGPAAPAPTAQIDRLVFARLKQLGIQPANLCSDAVFLRRVYLDTTGSLPTAQAAAQFLADTSPGKRTVLIDDLLSREEFSSYAALKWSDLLRIKAEFPINLWPNAAQAYYRWVLEAMRANMPYDRFVRELLTGSGSNFRDPQVNFYRALQSHTPPALAQAAALTFMGVRAEKWPAPQLEGMAAFFSRVAYKHTNEWKEEVIFFDQSTPVPTRAVFPDGTSVTLDPARDPREVFADWLTSPKNPWFTRNIANRVWSWLLGRGIIHEPDDIRPDNPPRNPELLAYLEQELIAGKYDLKRLYRLILTSNTYQLASIPRSQNPDAALEFAYYPLRRLDAEVLADAINQITGTTEQYTSAIPEPYTFIPEEERSVNLPDGSISSAFLELFGRPPRDSGLEAERNNRPSAAQRLHMLNSSQIQRKIEQSPRLNFLQRNARSPMAVVNGLYLTILSRYPTPEELKLVQAYPSKGREGVIDLTWALFNSAEFLYRH